MTKHRFFAPFAVLLGTASAVAYASDNFEGMTCERLQVERSKRLTLYADLANPPLFPSRSEAERRKELTQAKTDIQTIEGIQVSKKCAGANANWTAHTNF
jgi:hypothetical protein